MDRLLLIEGRAVAVVAAGLGVALDVSPVAILVTSAFACLGYAHVDPRRSIDTERSSRWRAPRRRSRRRHAAAACASPA